MNEDTIERLRCCRNKTEHSVSYSSSTLARHVGILHVAAVWTGTFYM